MYSKYIKNAAKSVFSDAFSLTIDECQAQDKNYQYYSSIDFIDDNTIIKVYFGFKKDTLVDMIEAYMFEENPDDELLKDFSAEMANLIVGKAKVFAQQDSKVVDIAIPKILENLPQNIELKLDYSYKNSCFSICIK
jgi:CheY-specific phosphatase CheX